MNMVAGSYTRSITTMLLMVGRPELGWAASVGENRLCSELMGLVVMCLRFWDRLSKIVKLSLPLGRRG